MSKTMTVQFRMTKRCNAECSYCINPFASSKKMSLDDFKISIDYLTNTYLPSIGVKKGDYIDLEFVGGEISLLPTSLIRDCSNYAKKTFSVLGFNYNNGCQSNFVGSTDKLIALWDVFDGNMSTSIDHFSDNRKLKGSADTYRAKFDINRTIVTNRTPIRSVYVIDSDALNHAREEFNLAVAGGYPIGLYPAYEANNPVNLADKTSMSSCLGDIMDSWVLKENVMVEPLGHILRATVDSKLSSCNGCNHACPFTIGCSKKSVCVEPDGDLYVCMDMSETNRFKLGNALSGTHDTKLIKKLARRGMLLEDKCLKCPYVKLCHGGCLNHALIDGDEYSKSDFCEVWKYLFKKSEDLCDEHGAKKIKNWLDDIGKEKFYC